MFGAIFAGKEKIFTQVVDVGRLVVVARANRDFSIFGSRVSLVCASRSKKWKPSASVLSREIRPYPVTSGVESGSFREFPVRVVVFRCFCAVLDTFWCVKIERDFSFLCGPLFRWWLTTTSSTERHLGKVVCSSSRKKKQTVVASSSAEQTRAVKSAEDFRSLPETPGANPSCEQCDNSPLRD